MTPSLVSAMEQSVGQVTLLLALWLSIEINSDSWQMPDQVWQDGYFLFG